MEENGQKRKAVQRWCTGAEKGDYVMLVYVMLVFFFLGVQVCTKMRIVDGAILHRPLFSFLQTGQFLKVEKGNLLTWQQL